MPGQKAESGALFEAIDCALEKSLCRLKVGVKFRLRIRQKSRRSNRRHQFSSNNRTTEQVSRLFYWQLFAITVAICCHKFPCLKRNEGIPPMHWFRVFFFLLMRTHASNYFSYTTWSVLLLKQSNAVDFSRRDVAGKLAVSYRTGSLWKCASTPHAGAHLRNKSPI